MMNKLVKSMISMWTVTNKLENLQSSIKHDIFKKITIKICPTQTYAFYPQNDTKDKLFTVSIRVVL